MTNIARHAVLLVPLLFSTTIASADGTVKVPLPGQSRFAIRAASGSTLSVTAKNGLIKLPPGKYSITGYSGGIQTVAGEYWTVFASGMKPIAITVAEGKTTQVKIAEPFVASVKVSSSSLPNMSMDLSTVGAAGESVTIYGPNPPGFTVKGKTGGSWNGSFHYG